MLSVRTVQSGLEQADERIVFKVSVIGHQDVGTRYQPTART